MEYQYHTSCFKVTRPSTIQTCDQCRRRKVRCDKRRGACANCERLGLPCSYASTQAVGEPLRLRGIRACIACRERKVKCSATLPACTACGKRGQACVYPRLKRRARSLGYAVLELDRDRDFDANSDQHDSEQSPSTQMPPPVQRRANNHNATRPHRHGASRDSSGPSDDLLVALVDVFFDAVYPMPSYAFLHPQITKARCRDRRPAHDALASALCAVAVLYLDSGGTSTGIVAVDRETAASWILAAEQSIWLSLESPTIPRLQTLLLIIHHHMETGHFQRAFMLTATAARFAAAMRLNHERPDLGSIPREVRRRALWSLKIIERYFSVGITEFDLLPLDAIFIDFPGTEEAFMLEGRALQQQDGQGIEEGGAYRLLVRLERIRIDIMKLTRSVASLHKSLPSLVDLVRHRDQVLSGIGSPESLPGGDICSSGTVDLAGDSWLPRRILAHLSWHQAHCDLYRILLRGYPEAAPDVVLQGTDQAALAAAEQQCLHHASRIIQIVTALNQKSTRHLLLEFDTAICAYHATRLVLFISRFGTSADRPSPEYAASRAALCLAALKRFFPSSALVAPIIQELEQSLQVFSEQRQQRPRQSCRKRKPAGLAPSSVDDQPHQRLAIHSLLRQADFSGNDSESDDETNGETAGQAMTPASMTAAAENRGLREQYEGQPAGLSSSSTENSAPLQIFPGGGEPGLFTPTGTVTATSSRYNTSSTHNMGVGISAYSGGTAFPNFALDAADEWDFSTGSRSALPFQEPGDAVAMATVGDAQHSFFAWWGPQDWDWL